MRVVLLLVLLCACSATKRNDKRAPEPTEGFDAAMQYVVPTPDANVAPDARSSAAPLTLRPPPIKREWRECIEDSECTHVWNCRDHGTAINRKFKDRANTAAKVGCKYSELVTPSMDSFCQEGVCQSKPKIRDMGAVGDQTELDELIEAARQQHDERQRHERDR